MSVYDACKAVDEVAHYCHYFDCKNPLYEITPHDREYPELVEHLFEELDEELDDESLVD